MSFPELQVPKNGRKIWNIDLIMILVLKFDFFRGGLPEPVVHAVSRPWTAGKIPKLPPKFVLPSKGGREMHSSNSSKKVSSFGLKSCSRLASLGQQSMKIVVCRFFCIPRAAMAAPTITLTTTTILKVALIFRELVRIKFYEPEKQAIEKVDLPTASQLVGILT